VTARRAAVAAAALVVATMPAARADEGHQVTATCSAADRAAVVPPSRYTASAEAGGHVRPVSTTVECSVRLGELSRGTFGGTMPGPYVVAYSVTSDTWAGENATVCVSAWAYWSDGHTLATPVACGQNIASVQAAT
jgi:hypothetical protein